MDKESRDKFLRVRGQVCGDIHDESGPAIEHECPCCKSSIFRILQFRSYETVAECLNCGHYSTVHEG